jgi:hypothetical protein
MPDAKSASVSFFLPEILHVSCAFYRGVMFYCLPFSVGLLTRAISLWIGLFAEKGISVAIFSSF